MPVCAGSLVEVGAVLGAGSWLSDMMCGDSNNVVESSDSCVCLISSAKVLQAESEHIETSVASYGFLFQMSLRIR